MRLFDERQLARAPPFCRLDQGQLRRVRDLALAQNAAIGTVVFDEGQPALRFHLILSGHVRLVRLTAEGEQIIVLHVPAGQLFGLGTPLGRATRQETAIAADDCQMLSWPAALWQVFSDDYASFAAETMRALGARAEEMSNRIVELSTKLVEQRIACALLRMIGQSGRKVAGGIEIGFPISRQNIADMTGTTLHTVSRVLSAWEKRGLIHSTRCNIVVADPHGMVAISSGVGRADQPVTAAASAARKAASSRPYSSQASITV